MRTMMFLAAWMICATSVLAQGSKVTEPSDDALNAFKAVMDAAYAKDNAKLKSLIHAGDMPAEDMDELVKAIGEQIAEGLQRPKPVASARAGKIAAVIMRYREPGDTEDTVEPTFFMLVGEQWKLLLDDPQDAAVEADWEAIEAWADKKENELDPSGREPSTQPTDDQPPMPVPPAPPAPPAPMPR